MGTGLFEALLLNGFVDITLLEDFVLIVMRY